MPLHISISCKRNRDLPHVDAAKLTDQISKNAAELLQEQLKDNFTGRGGRRFWLAAADSVQVEPVRRGYLVAVYQPGVRMQWQGGTQRPSGKTSEATGRPTRSLLIPHARSQMRERGESLTEFLKHKKGAVRVLVRKATGKVYLIMDEETRVKLPKGVKGQGRRRTKDTTRLTLIGALVKSAQITPHPNVIPTDDALTATARTAAMEVLRNHHLIP